MYTYIYIYICIYKGKRAKQMRLRKVSELIHCSQSLPNVNCARVEVTFQDYEYD